ncbi:hypothetical protein L484_018922 [Morus notabilis]|uniref:Uncharacterized protein n=1 Tax=Morus notabilis TaxID=981085 RepID=W9RDE5_9ROSA|nr:hypothetical protein L484_018922 [Morus notabilis]
MSQLRMPLRSTLEYLRIQLGFPSSDAEISAVYSCSTGHPTVLGSGSVRIGDLYAEEEIKLSRELRVHDLYTEIRAARSPRLEP